MSKTREEVQSEALSSWISNDCNGALILGTGVGKTKIAIDGIKHHNKDARYEDGKYSPIILWLTNSERLRDVDTINDFIEWDAKDLLPIMQFECIQTAYKWKDQAFDLVIADEGDFMLTPEYFKFFTNNSFTNLLFLTATVDKNKQEMLDSICKTVYKYTTTEAQEAGILNKSVITIAKFNLDNVDKYVKSKGKGGKTFLQTENEAYEYLEKRCVLELLNLNNAKKECESEMLMSGVISPQASTTYSNSVARHKFWTTKRANFLWSLKSSRKAAKELLKQSLLGEGNKSNKALVFCKRTEQAELICKHTYHSKNKESSTALEDLNEGKINAVAVCNAVNRGVNLVGLTHIVKESYDGSATAFQQQHGRGTRLSPTDTMKLFILVPYYYSKGARKPTQAAKWAKSMTEDFGSTFQTTEV